MTVQTPRDRLRDEFLDRLRRLGAAEDVLDELTPYLEQLVDRASRLGPSRDPTAELRAAQVVDPSSTPAQLLLRRRAANLTEHAAQRREQGDPAGAETLEAYAAHLLDAAARLGRPDGGPA